MIPFRNKSKKVKKEIIKNRVIENSDDITNESYMNALDDFSYELEGDQSISSQHRDNLGTLTYLLRHV